MLHKCLKCQKIHLIYRGTREAAKPIRPSRRGFARELKSGTGEQLGGRWTSERGRRTRDEGGRNVQYPTLNFKCRMKKQERKRGEYENYSNEGFKLVEVHFLHDVCGLQ